MAKITIFSDGACSGNPGPGGWATRLLYADGRICELGGFAADTTNNRMELQAAIEGLKAIAPDDEITIVTDSEYMLKGITEWIHGWKRNGWRTAGKDPVKNVELWQRLDAAQARHKVTWKWIKGHAGHAENERADALARAGMAPFKS